MPRKTPATDGPLSAFTNQLKHLREYNNLTQEAIAELVKVDVRNYRRLECGAQGDLRFSTLERYAKALKIHWWDLMSPKPLNVTIEAKRKPPKAPHYNRKKTTHTGSTPKN